MLKQNTGKVNILLLLTILITAAIIVSGSVIILQNKSEPKLVKESVPEKTRAPVRQKHVIEYSRLKKDQALKNLMQKRKDKYGIDKGVDIIARSDESVKIGDSTVSMDEIQAMIDFKAILSCIEKKKN